MSIKKDFMIEKVKEYMETCPFLTDLNSFGVDFLSNDPNTSSIEKTPVKAVIERYIDGSSKRQFAFVLASRFNYSDEIRNNIENSGFYENLENWVEEQNENENFPDFGDDKEIEEIELLTGGYLFNIAEGMNTARYQVQLRVIYIQNKKER